MRVLLVEDETELATWLAKSLAQRGIVLDWVDRIKFALPQLQQGYYDALLLDLGLPDGSGHELLSQLQKSDYRVPILILTARDSLLERVSTLKEGADDFLAKPFAVEELEARIEALVRRAKGADHPRHACGLLRYDSRSRQFLLADTPLTLSQREHAVLKVLIQHPNIPLDKQQIHARIFSDSAETHPEAIEVIIHRLRKRLEGSTIGITHVRSLGYLLTPLSDHLN